MWLEYWQQQKELHESSKTSYHFYHRNTIKREGKLFKKTTLVKKQRALKSLTFHQDVLMSY